MMAACLREMLPSLIARSEALEPRPMTNCCLSIGTRCPLNRRNSVGADAAGSAETRGLASGEELRGARNAGVGCGVSGITDAGRMACGGAGGIDAACGRDFDA